MAKISQLLATTFLDGSESLPIVQDGRTLQTTIAQFVAQVIPFVQDWYKGDKGNPGGNLRSIGSFAEARVGGLVIPSGTRLVETDSFDGGNSGGAKYIDDPSLLAIINSLASPDNIRVSPWATSNNVTVSDPDDQGFYVVGDNTTGGGKTLRNQNLTLDPGTYTYVLEVAKDDVPAATRVPYLGLASGVGGGITLDTATGQASSASSSVAADAYAVLDMGIYWLVWVQTTFTVTTTVAYWIAPAFAVGVGGSSNQSVIGSVRVRNPKLLVGTYAAPKSLVDVRTRSAFRASDEHGAARAFGLSDILVSPETFGGKGDDRTDNTDQFYDMAQYIQRQGGGIVRMKPKAVYRMGRQTHGDALLQPAKPFKFQSVDGLVIEGNGATLKWNDGLYYGGFEADLVTTHSGGTDNSYNCSMGNLLEIRSCADAVIENLKIDGNQANVILGGPWGSGGGIQSQGDGLSVYRSPRIRISSVLTQECPRDGLYVWGIGDQQPVFGSLNGGADALWDGSEFRGVQSLRNGRQGLSIVAGRGIRFAECEFSHTGQSRIISPPSAGLDIEPNNSWCGHIFFDNCLFKNNYGSGVLRGNSLSNDIHFVGGEIWSGFQPNLYTKGSNDAIYSTTTAADQPNITFTGMKIHGCTPNGLEGQRFIDCSFDDQVHPLFGRSATSRGSILASAQGYYVRCAFYISGPARNFYYNSSAGVTWFDGCRFIYAGDMADKSSLMVLGSRTRLSGRNSVELLSAPATGYYVDTDHGKEERSGVFKLDPKIFYGSMTGATDFIAPNHGQATAA